MAKNFPDVAHYTVPGLSDEQGQTLASVLQDRLHALNDLQLVLKHVHWNVVGRNFISVHEMIDPQVDVVRGFVDEVAERIATLGYSPNGLSGGIVADRSWNDYSIGRAGVYEHLAALDMVYTGLLEDHRKALKTAGEIDPITEDMLIGQVKELELFQWFVRAHLENSGGELADADATTEKAAAAAVTA
ncbi:DNA starvation/stationary phase protection protein [Kocuria coralli]|uniref:DNA starvation/stationary phase protection protein n=1 Tax=Kocuria coralli TaxID=1461025 RepID=A0A5J5KZ29_9MICC|nr:DNA starvation/stationary phase protection protein [Kocuria coralli]KAA9394924.1 DNA starvation/stationary phase protection protein [Kocuria coralli]